MYKLETQGSWWCSLEARGWRANGKDSSQNLKAWEPGQEKTDVSAPGDRQRAVLTFFCLLILLRPSVDSMMFTHTGKDNMLSSAQQFKC